ncbi:DUF1598 domain-containing protein [Planctomycetaceae bacterium SH139]
MKSKVYRTIFLSGLTLSSWLLLGVCLRTPHASGQDSVPSPSTETEKFSLHLQAGEFATARKLIPQLSADRRDWAKSQLATMLGTSGYAGAAAETVGAIGQPAVRQATIERFRERVADYGSALSYGAGAGSRDRLPAGGGSGGAAIADFDSLMNLIQTTIAPDTWEALGGPSTMAPYRAGIHVDPQGLVRDIAVGGSDQLANLRAQTLGITRGAAEIKSNTNWTAPSNLRVVSLKRLRTALLANGIAGLPASNSMQNLAGLSEIQYLILSEDDVLLAGRVGGIDPAAGPWPRDLDSGKVALGLELLTASAAAVLDGQPYGCSIDPTEAGLQAAQQVAAGIARKEIPTATAAAALADALGPQNISLFAVLPDAPLAWLLVDADRHMKQLALGEHPLPPGVFNYLEIIEQSVKRAPNAAVPSGQMLRLWFAAQPKSIRKSNEGDTFELSGSPLRLISAKEFANQQGERQQAGEDPLGQAFTKQFNQNFRSIASQYPVYDRLRGAFELTAAMQLLRQTVGPQEYRELVGELSQPELFLDASLATPKQCQSIAVRHTIRSGRQRHEVYVASGGVHIDPAQTSLTSITTYPQLDSLREQLQPQPVENDRWWWDQ